VGAFLGVFLKVIIIAVMDIGIAIEIAKCRNNCVSAIKKSWLYPFKGQEIIYENGADLIKCRVLPDEAFFNNPLRKRLGILTNGSSQKPAKTALLLIKFQGRLILGLVRIVLN